MDYKTQPTTREELRYIAKLIRKVFKCTYKIQFDVINAIEQVKEDGTVANFMNNEGHYKIKKREEM